MTENIRIGATKHLVPVYERLKKEAQFFQECEIATRLSVSRDGQYNLLDYEITGEIDADIFDSKLSLCYHQIAEAVAEVIITWWQPEIFREIIQGGYPELCSSDVERVINKLFTVSREPGVFMQVVTSNSAWKKEIATRVVDFLETCSSLVIDGFINFRLQDFKTELEHIVNDAVEEFLLEKEYDDFIDLLRYFVETQEPRIKKIHVVLFPSGSFNMYDSNYSVIDNNYLEGFILDLMDNDLSYEDLLVSALITIAPLEIVLHLPDTVGNMSSAVNTIQSVFGARVTMCIGCPKCFNFQIKS